MRLVVEGLNNATMGNDRAGTNNGHKMESDEFVDDEFTSCCQDWLERSEWYVNSGLVD